MTALTQRFVVAELLKLWHDHDPDPALDFQRNAGRAQWQAETLKIWQVNAHGGEYSGAYAEACKRIRAERGQAI